MTAWRESYAELMPPARLAALDPADSAARWRRQLANGMSRGIAVAELDGQVVGFASCARQRAPALTHAGYTGEVTALYLLRAAQGHGAGRLLMRAMARRLIAEGYRGMALWVLVANTPARRFYEHLGGTAIARQIDGDDEELAYGWRSLDQLARPGGREQP